MLYPLRLAATVVLVALLSACSGMKSTSIPSLTDTLTKQLGVTSNQAEAGVGAMLDASKSKLSPGQYEQVSKAIPGADKYVKAAQDSLGTSQITDLNSAFSKLGMSPDMVDKFKPAVLDYAGKYGGSTTKSLLAGVL
jgi:Protein of unknown function VcgC/VcgE (DUF2780)